MKRVLRIFAVALAAVVGLLLLAAILLPLFFDANDFKDDIAELVAQSTGRELVLEGDLELSVFPWLAIDIGPARLGNAPGFGERPFAELSGARLGVRLLPLLRREIEFGELSLEGLRLNLERDAAGKTNWEDLTASEGGEAEEEAAASAGGFATGGIAGVNLRDAAIDWTDREAGEHFTIVNWNLSTGRLVPGEAFPISTDLELRSGEPATVAVLVAKAEVYLEADRYRINGPHLEINLQSEVEAQQIELTARAGVINADLQRETLSIDVLEIRLADLVLETDISGERIFAEPTLRGSLRVREFSPRALLEALDSPVETADPDVLVRLALDGQWQLRGDALRVAPLNLRMDDSKISGEFAVANLATQAIRFDLALDALNLDRYLAPESDDGGPAGESAESATELPLDELRDLDLKGDLQVGAATLGGLKFEDIVLTLAAQDGQLRIHPLRARFYGGRYEGNIALNAGREAAHLSLHERVNGIQFGKLAGDLFGREAISGVGRGEAVLQARGRDTDQLLRTLSGSLAFELADGALEGVDLWFEIRRAQALFRKESVPTREGPKRTEFTDMRGTATLTDGVLRNDDLVLGLEFLRVTGRGEVNLAAETVDYNVTATVLEVPDESGRVPALAGVSIPVAISGSLADPKVRPDLAAYASAEVQRRAKTAILEGLGLGDEEENGQNSEEEIEDQLKHKLKDLFGN